MISIVFFVSESFLLDTKLLILPLSTSLRKEKKEAL